MSFLPPRPEEGDVLPASKTCLRKCWVGKFSEVKECSDFFLEGTTPSLPGILVGGTVKDPDRYKPICQKYKNSYRFATLYDTTNKIPVFSAYTFTGPFKGERPDTWMIEPQLNMINNNINDNSEMILDEGEDPYPNQAGNNDYRGNMEEKKLSRGHLFPCSHAHDQGTEDSTFTLTNIVPQKDTFNSGSWNKMECKVRNTLKDNCKDANNNIKAYVVTGAVPSTNNTLNNRVNIPDLLWTAYCCYNNKKKTWIAKAHWGENKEDVKEKNKKQNTLPSETLAKLYEKLSEHYPGVQVFPDKCSVDIPKTLRLVGGDVLMDEDVHDHCVYDDDCVCSSVGIKGHYLPVV
ncbi:endonuclease domain-containing 1 protein-like [Coregonus clupeaformis]|uniref:endonuclease domain-containing 1 protein-like n=1 Tax=Coregonus clupeaformis TaxID=59861 RepID=UPI001E1C7E24|nr:endonuclease domain-containing 1 protein-like [Coregonus clupeaformis]